MLRDEETNYNEEGNGNARKQMCKDEETNELRWSYEMEIYATVMMQDRKWAEMKKQLNYNEVEQKYTKWLVRKGRKCEEKKLSTMTR